MSDLTDRVEPLAMMLPVESTLDITELAPDPREAWRRQLEFVGWDRSAYVAAAATVEPLFAAGPAIVAQTYAYFAQVPATAAILGWSDGVDERHLVERRRFLTVWLARTLGLDTGDEFALYLHRAGILHAGHGPRRIHVPATYVTGAIGLVQDAFARAIGDADLPGSTVAAGLSAWSRYLGAQLDLMLMGYHAGRALDTGAFAVECQLFGRLRAVGGATAIWVRANAGQSVGELLRRLVEYQPRFRDEMLVRAWETHDDEASLWREVSPAYAPRDGWRVLHNGLDLRYHGGFAAVLGEGDVLALFPPGR
jgi:molybdopterin converting factor small subunit